MSTRRSHAGGFFLFVGIIGGLVLGVATGQAMLGVLAGTVAGAATAMIVWLVDRRR